MTTFYLDFEGGNDANDGTTFANRWKTITGGPTAARIAPGDEIRIMASPDETLVGDATWTGGSTTVTLASAVNATISNCEAAWTASANVTCSTSTSNYKEGTKAATINIATGFTTGKAAYVATGALDLSSYQQVSFWIYNSAAIVAGRLRLALCSDTLGATSVQDIAIPAIASTSRFIPVVVDVGAALPSSVQSIAIYADVDPGAVNLTIDNIIACKASSSADALTHNSLISKVHSRVWEASTAYALNAIRKPTQPNRNGWRYKATTGGTTGASEPTWPEAIGGTVTDGTVVWTCDGPEETWFAIASVDGVTVKLDQANSTIPSSVRLYHGDTETVATYKREPILVAASANFSSTTLHNPQDSGTDASKITFSGGWNRTDMSTMTGETWVTGQNGNSQFIRYASARNYTVLKNLNGVRFDTGIQVTATQTLDLYNCHMNHMTTNGFDLSSALTQMRGIAACFNASAGVNGDTASALEGDRIHCDSNGSNPTNNVGVIVSNIRTRLNYVYTARNAYNIGKYSGESADCIVYNLVSSNSANAAIVPGGSTDNNPDMTFVRATASDTTILNPSQMPNSQSTGAVRFHALNGVSTDNRNYYSFGNIASVTDQRHTASGMAWKFSPTNVGCTSYAPMRMAVARIHCAANVAKSITIWTRRDSTNIKGKLYISGGQIAGVEQDVSIVCEPSINTWTESSALTFTPTEAGVVEIMFSVYDGVGTINGFWIDDLTVA